MSAHEPARRVEPSDVVLLALALLALELGVVTWRALERRSLAPLALDHEVVERLVRHEKHPGEDDRYFVVLAAADGGARVEHEVTRAVHDALAPGARVEKGEDERRMRVDGATVPLERDPLARGLLVALLLAIAPAVGHLAVALTRRTRGGDP